MQAPQTASSKQPQETGRDQVLFVTRVFAALVVPVLVTAFVMLYLFPNDSGRLFAWPVNPTISAMLLGATYLGGAYFFTRVIFIRQWHTVQLGFLPVSTFAGILGIATLLHWDRFTQGHIAFLAWSLLYFTLPFVIPVIWYRNHKVNRGNTQTAEKRFSHSLRLATGAVGVVLLAAGAGLMLFPQMIIPFWPWTLTPLTARVMAAKFILPGLVGLGVATDGRWSSASILFQSQVLTILLFFMAIVRANDEIQWSQWSSWVFPISLSLVLLLISWAWLETANWAARPAESAGEKFSGEK